VNTSTRKKWLRRKRRIAARLRPRKFKARAKPMLAARNIRYEVADRTRAIGCGGIGAIHLLARKAGLIDAIDRDLELLKVHLPYHESDHVLNIAYNILCDGDCLQDMERLRNDEAYLDALGASRIPDPTTAGDFCRRFESGEQVNVLQEAINSVRLGVWKKQPPEFFEQAILDVDGTLAPTDAECKAGMDISYDGQWGYHPLVVSLANTKEPLYLHNRPANRPSHEDAAEYLERAIVLCREAGFKNILMRGDTDFSQTACLDGWDDLRNDKGEAFVRFLFGLDAMPNLKALANALPESAWKELRRPPRYDVQTEPRDKPENVKEQVIAERGFKHLRLRAEHVAEIRYRPVACDRDYRLIITRKTIDVEAAQEKLWDECRYFFHITNDADTPAQKLVLSANQRCDQENLIEQLKNGVKAMQLPVNDLVSNWAYMVMASVAWTLKAWWGLMLPEAKGRGREVRQQQKRDAVRMEFKRFVASIVRLPCQILRSGRRLIYRLLSYSPWQEPLLAGVAAWRTRTQC
jgi:Transposase DDE domain group 1